MMTHLLLALPLLLQDGLTADEFEKVRRELDVKARAWATIPWKVWLADALETAAREKKPVFLNVNTGNALGFV
jgi:hypothetical protein